MSVKIFTNEINKIKIKNNIPNLDISFLMMLSQFLQWETNLLVDNNSIPLNQTALAEVLSITTRTVRRNIKTLIDNKIIVPINHNNSNLYCVNPIYMFFGKNISEELLRLFMTDDEIEAEDFNYRNCKAYKIWRENSLIKYNYSCQCCGSQNLLEVHHIENFSDKVDKRYDLDNSIVLCKKCHSITVSGSFHSVYGTRNNNRDQLQSYIEHKRSELNLPPKTI